MWKEREGRRREGRKREKQRDETSSTFPPSFLFFRLLRFFNNNNKQTPTQLTPKTSTNPPSPLANPEISESTLSFHSFSALSRYSSGSLPTGLFTTCPGADPEPEAAAAAARFGRREAARGRGAV
ncbi:hypothetical protein BDY24DRAFT_377052 [Mrakia frigida]|uniref:uncharacterized protein n=1 Tax=Mrakia frigida TaxID=29902 RepID=UPI003FCC0806